MQPLTKIIDVDGYTHIKRDTDVIATFQNQDDANLFLQAESMVSAADLSIQAGLGLLKEREELIAERDALAAMVARAKACFPENGTTRPQDVVCAIFDVLKDAPQTSLGRRDARVAAEALDHAIENMPRRVSLEAQLDWLVGEKWKIEKQVRHQAEGDAL